MINFRLIPPNTKLSFVEKRLFYFIFSVFLVLGSLTLYMVKGLNFGIDFKGGILVEVRSPSPFDLGHLRGQLNDLELGDVAIQEFGQPSDVLIRIQRQEGGDDAQQQTIEKLKEMLGNEVDYRRVEFVGPKVSEELLHDGMMAVLFAMGAILIYIWFRFEWQFGVGAVIALSHDVLSTIGLFSLIEHEFNLATVAAVLTIAGYSINDTVVVYDRVRENIRKYKTLNFADLFNLSINETLSRTVMTSLTTLIALFALYFLGGEVIRDFALAMIWGVLVGTYSSICLAVPLLLYMKIDRGAPGGLGGGEKGTGYAASTK
ncbi:MAG: protein translocase subunit SecF [Magnetovibrio sp.]|nr:protein translocase subunit SecF [Magnetovibrio sp.]